MTKEVLVSLVGNQSADGQQNNIELVTIANYYKRNGHHFILYDEMPENDKGQLIKNTLRFNETFFEMTKKGSVSAQMLFNPKESNTTYYSTPAGLMNIETTTTEYVLMEEKDYIEVYIRYILEVNRSYSSENEILIRVSPNNG